MYILHSALRQCSTGGGWPCGVNHEISFMSWYIVRKAMYSYNDFRRICVEDLRVLHVVAFSFLAR